MDTEKKPRRARRVALWAGVGAAAALAACWLWRSGLLQKLDSIEELRAVIEGAGALSGVVYFVVQLLSVILAPIPSNVTMAAGALALGFWPAMLLGVAAIYAGSMLVFLAARRLGRRAVQGWVDRGVMEKYLPVIEEKQDMFLFLTLLFPFFPDDVLCILAGVTSIPTARFALLMALARPWGLVFSALLGSGALSLPIWGWAIMLAALAAVFCLALRYSAQIEDALFALVSRLSKRKRRESP